MPNIQLPKKPDSDILQLLIRAKSFLDHAIMHSKVNSPFDIMISIHNLDNFVEYMLHIIIRHLEIEESTGKNLDTSEIAQLAAETNKFLKSTYSIELPYISEIKLLRQVRNLVQHAMVDPASGLSRFITICQRFFDKSLIKLFGITPNEIKMSAVIKNEDIKAYLLKSEEFIDNKKYLEAVVASRDAFENAKFEKIKNSPLKIEFVPALLESKRSSKYLYNYLKRLNLELEIETLGIEYRLYQKYDEYIQHIPYEYCSNWLGSIVMQRPWSRDDALFCYNFVSDVLYRWEYETTPALYDTDIQEFQFSWKSTIGGIELKRISNGGCEYGMSENEYMKYFFVDSDTIILLLRSIIENNIYKFTTETYINGVVSTRSHEFIEILSIDSNLVTNNPARWEIFLWMKKIPLTLYFEKQKDGIWVTDYLDVCTSNYDELKKFGLPENIVNVILYPRKTAVSISNL